MRKCSKDLIQGFPVSLLPVALMYSAPTVLHMGLQLGLALGEARPPRALSSQWLMSHRLPSIPSQRAPIVLTTCHFLSCKLSLFLEAVLVAYCRCSIHSQARPAEILDYPHAVSCRLDYDALVFLCGQDDAECQCRASVTAPRDVDFQLHSSPQNTSTCSLQHSQRLSFCRQLKVHHAIHLALADCC